MDGEITKYYPGENIHNVFADVFGSMANDPRSYVANVFIESYSSKTTQATQTTTAGEAKSTRGEVRVNYIYSVTREILRNIRMKYSGMIDEDFAVHLFYAFQMYKLFSRGGAINNMISNNIFYVISQVKSILYGMAFRREMGTAAMRNLMLDFRHRNEGMFSVFGAKYTSRGFRETMEYLRKHLDPSQADNGGFFAMFKRSSSIVKTEEDKSPRGSVKLGGKQKQLLLQTKNMKSIMGVSLEETEEEKYSKKLKEDYTSIMREYIYSKDDGNIVTYIPENMADDSHVTPLQFSKHCFAEFSRFIDADQLDILIARYDDNFGSAGLFENKRVLDDATADDNKLKQWGVSPAHIHNGSVTNASAFGVALRYATLDNGAVSNAEKLFEEIGASRDRDTMEKLYGITPTQIHIFFDRLNKESDRKTVCRYFSVGILFFMMRECVNAVLGGAVVLQEQANALGIPSAFKSLTDRHFHVFVGDMIKRTNLFKRGFVMHQSSDNEACAIVKKFSNVAQRLFPGVKWYSALPVLGYDDMRSLLIGKRNISGSGERITYRSASENAYDAIHKEFSVLSNIIDGSPTPWDLILRLTYHKNLLGEMHTKIYNHNPFFVAPHEKAINNEKIDPLDKGYIPSRWYDLESLRRAHNAFVATKNIVSDVITSFLEVVKGSDDKRDLIRENAIDESELINERESIEALEYLYSKAIKGKHNASDTGDSSWRERGGSISCFTKPSDIKFVISSSRL